MRIKLLTLGIISLLMLGSVLSAEKSKEVNFWQNLFTEPIESIYFIMKDGTAFRYTHHYEDGVYITIKELEEMLKKFKNRNYGIKNIMVVIHNHLLDCKFSPEDRKFYKRLKRHGFNGFFLLYSNARKKAYVLED